MSDILIVPAPADGDFVALSSTRSKGRLFEKHILNYGDLFYPGVKGGKVRIDDEFADILIANFKAKYCPFVQIPLAGPKNEHSEAPERNIGQVVGLTKRDQKIYAVLDVRKAEYADAVGETLLGASAMFSNNYVDTKTLKSVGPTLLHVAVTNRPYVYDLDDYSEVIAASADGIGEAVILTASREPKESAMATLDELIGTLKNEHGIDVRALQADASKSEQTVALSNVIKDELLTSNVVALSVAGDEPTDEELAEAVRGAATTIVALSNSIKEKEEAVVRTAAEAEVDDLVTRGFIASGNRDAMVELSLTNADLFKGLIPAQAVVELSVERGTSVESTDAELAKAAVDRIAGSDEGQRLLVRK